MSDKKLSDVHKLSVNEVSMEEAFGLGLIDGPQPTARESSSSSPPIAETSQRLAAVGDHPFSPPDNS